MLMSQKGFENARKVIIDQVLDGWRAEGIKAAQENDRIILRPQKVTNNYSAWHTYKDATRATMFIRVINGDIRGIYRFYRKGGTVKKTAKRYARDVGERQQRAFSVGRRRISRYESVRAAWRTRDDGTREKIRGPGRRLKPISRWQKQAYAHGERVLKPTDTHYQRKGHWVKMNNKRSIQDEKGIWRTYTKIPAFMVEYNVRESFLGAFTKYAHIFR